MELVETKEEDFRSLVLGEVEVVPPIVDLRTTARRKEGENQNGCNDECYKISKFYINKQSFSRPYLDITPPPPKPSSPPTLGHAGKECVEFGGEFALEKLFFAAR